METRTEDAVEQWLDPGAGAGGRDVHGYAGRLEVVEEPVRSRAGLHPPVLDQLTHDLGLARVQPVGEPPRLQRGAAGVLEPEREPPGTAGDLQQPAVRRHVPPVGQPGLLEGLVERDPVPVALAVDQGSVDVEDHRGDQAHRGASGTSGRIRARTASAVKPWCASTWSPGPQLPNSSMPIARSTSPAQPSVHPASMLTVTTVGSGTNRVRSRAETTRTAYPSSRSRSATASTSCTSDPVATSSTAGSSSERGVPSCGSACRDRISAVGPSVRSRASRQASAVSASSAGRSTWRPGITRNDSSCSTG